jgi:thioesterase domain-containing protein
MLAGSTAVTNLQPEVLQCSRQPTSKSEGEASETVFLIPGFGGVTEVERGLQAACAPDLRLELVDLPDWPELAAQGVTSEGLIKQIADEIDSQVPEGGLKIAGYSMGANLGLAVAQLLISQGRSIDFFGTLDGWAELTLLPQHSMPLRAARRLGRQLPHLLRTRLGGVEVAATATRQHPVARCTTPPTAASPAGRGFSIRLQSVLARVVARWAASCRGPLLRLIGRQRGWLPCSHFSQQWNLHLRGVLLEKLLRGWFRASRPNFVDIEMVLFRTADHNPASADDLGWGQHFRKVRLVHLNGGHESMLLPPHLSTLREQFVHAVRVSSRDVANRA